MAKEKVWLAWSAGKDAGEALRRERERGEVEVTRLLVTVTQDYDRVSMHGVREELVRAQAVALGLPLRVVRIPSECSNEDYEAAMAAAMEAARGEGVSAVAFGDIFLEDVREYRERQLSRAGMGARFPLWGEDTASLAREMIESGVEAYVTCLDPRKVPPELAGCRFDERLLGDLPADCDPCGENGEFHTFLANAPTFSRRVAVEVGETVGRGGFVFTDVVAAAGDSQALSES